MSKETEDALHMLLHCSLKDTEYETQFEQYKIVRNYITNLQKEKAKYRRKAKRYRNILTELEEHCEVMLRIFEKMSEEQRQEQLDKYIIYDKF